MLLNRSLVFALTDFFSTAFADLDPIVDKKKVMPLSLLGIVGIASSSFLLISTSMLTDFFQLDTLGFYCSSILHWWGASIIFSCILNIHI